MSAGNLLLQVAPESRSRFRTANPPMPFQREPVSAATYRVQSVRWARFEEPSGDTHRTRVLKRSDAAAFSPSPRESPGLTRRSQLDSNSMPAVEYASGSRHGFHRMCCHRMVFFVSKLRSTLR